MHSFPNSSIRRMQATNATHVVSSVIYGTTNVFKFTKTYTDEEDAEHVAAKVKITIGKALGRK